MEKLKLFIFALLVLSGVAVGIFFIGNFLLHLFGIVFALSLEQSAGIVFMIVSLKFIIHFLFPAPQVSNVVLENQNLYLQNMNEGLRIILASIIKYHGGEIRIPSYRLKQVTEDSIILHDTDFTSKEEIFTLVEDEGEEKPIGKSSLN